MREKEYFDTLCNTADGAFIVDAEKRILSWNKGAEKILGFREADVLKHECFRVISGRDRSDKPLCGEVCRIHSTAMQGIPQKNYDMRVRSRDGHPLWLNVTILSHPDGEQPFVAHLVRDITPEKAKDLALEQFLANLDANALMLQERSSEKPAIRGSRTEPQPQGKPDVVLSEREIEVLTLLAEGLPTKLLAQKLNISHFTARNHIQNILVKLNLHSKAQAVSYAFRKGIL